MAYPTHVLEVIGDNVSKFEEIMSVLDETRPEKKGEGNYKMAINMFKGYQKFKERVVQIRKEHEEFDKIMLEKRNDMKNDSK